jgi:hypothetical protein
VWQSGYRMQMTCTGCRSGGNRPLFYEGQLLTTPHGLPFLPAVTQAGTDAPGPGLRLPSDTPVLVLLVDPSGAVLSPWLVASA